MKRVNPHDFYALALTVHPLTDMAEGTTVGENAYALVNCRDWMRVLLTNPTIPLRVCKQACRTLMEAIRKVLPDQPTRETWDSKIDAWLMYEIGEAAKNFETVLAAELQTVDTYYVDQKGAYSTPELIERADIVLPESIRQSLPDAALLDLRQAGRAFVLDLPTAAGFHLLRAVESVIRVYFDAVVGTAPKKRDWGYYIEELRNAGGDAKVVATIDQVRDLHRNPLMHPEEVLTEEQALSLFGISQSVIVAMAADWAKRRAKGTAPSTPAAVSAPRPTT